MIIPGSILTRARATELSRNPRLHRGVQAGPLRASRPRVQEKARGRKSKFLYPAKKAYFVHTLVHISVLFFLFFKVCFFVS